MVDSTLFFNGKIHALDKQDRVVSSMLVCDGKVKALDMPVSDQESLPPEVERVDLARATVTPGLIDTHIHLATTGNVTKSAFLYYARSVREIVEGLQQHAEGLQKSPFPSDNPARPGKPAMPVPAAVAVVGYGFNFRPDILAEGRMPTAADLDQVAVDRPVLLFDVNKVVVNSYLLKQIPPSPPGAPGTAQRDQGLFFGPARGLVPAECWKKATGASDTKQDAAQTAAMEQDIVRSMDICAANGITGVVNANINLEQLEIFRRLNEQGRLPIKVMLMMIGISPAELAEHNVTPGRREGNLEFGPLKFFFDNFVMHKTAWMHEPYVGEPDNTGGPRLPVAEFHKVLADTFEAGWAVGVHCTGDRALDELVSIFEAEKSKMAGLGRSHVIHGYFPSARAMEICRRQDVAFAVQPGFMRAWGDTLFETIGQERACAFLPLRTMLENGLTIAGGSDSPINWPVVKDDMATAMSRRTAAGRTLGNTENLSVREALGIYTGGAAYLAGWTGEAGVLSPGSRADFVVFDRDVPNLDAQSLADTRILMTVARGRIIYSKKKA